MTLTLALSQRERELIEVGVCSLLPLWEKGRG
jgi:hypothetical protein